MEKKESNTADREIRISRLLNAPIELVWEVWTNPEHIKNWWGPNGFTNTIHSMDMKKGGEWNLTMHGPDGTDYKNKTIFKKIVFKKNWFTNTSQHQSSWQPLTLNHRATKPL